MDREIQALDVRLTMGGEPTFVSIDDMEGAEWNTAALGTHKRERAGVLLARLKTAFAPGGFLQYGQGKWYPGEPLPRWALGCYWRGDGRPLWKNDRWLADETRKYSFGAADAARFGQRLAARLGIETSVLREAFEDGPTTCGGRRRRPLDAKVAADAVGARATTRAGARPRARSSRRLRLAVALELVRGRLALRALELRARHDVPDPGELADGSAAAV